MAKIHNRVMRELVEEAAQAGWTVTIRKGGHLKFEHPEAASVFSSSTPSDRRAVLNTRAQLRRNLKEAGTR